MDVIFDVHAAEELIQQMKTYCSGIVKETKDLMTVMNKGDGWKDRQRKAFQNNVDALAHELDQALMLESEYIRTFQERVNELRG